MRYSKITKNTNPSRTLTDLETALQRGNPVTIDYVDSQGVRTLRTVEPYEITTTQRGRIIVRAMCRLRRERRTFCPDAIDAYTIHKGRFTVEREDTEEGNAEPVTPPTTVAELIHRELLRDTDYDPQAALELSQLLAAA